MPITEPDDPEIFQARKRPYVWFPAEPGKILQLAIREAFCPGAEELALKRATRISVSLSPSGWISVEHDGRGFPVAPHPKFGVPAMQLALTHGYAGCRSLHTLKYVQTHLCRVSLAALNVLCARMEVLNVFARRSYHQAFRMGRPTSSPACLGPTRRKGLTLHFLPDYALLGPQRASPHALRSWWNRFVKSAGLPPRALHIRSSLERAGSPAEWLGDDAT